MPKTYHCHRCGRDNAIVNQCRCDPDNLPTIPTPYHWGEETFATLLETEREIQRQVAQYLCDADSGAVTYKGKTYCLNIRITVVDRYGKRLRPR